MKKWFLFIIIFIVLGAGIFFIISRNNNNNVSTEGQEQKQVKSDILSTAITKENFESVIEEFSSKYEGKDDYYYFDYAFLYNVTRDGLFADSDDEDASLKNIYGKTIKEIIAEGKDLMKTNNVSIKEFKDTLNESKDIQ